MKRAIFILLATVAVLGPTTVASAEVSPVLYLNRCRGGCTVNGGTDDARTMTSSIPCAGTVSCAGGGCLCTGGSAGTYMIEEFQNSQGQIGDAATEEWQQIVECVREVYSPYNVTVTDTLPANTISHTQGIIAGKPINIGYPNTSVGGIAPGGNCEPKDNVLSFTFANIYGGGTVRDRVLELCTVAAQETAHSFGLDHAFEFSDGRSTCNDPMTYRRDCGGQRFFRNVSAKCGEFAARPCRCGGMQNSHSRLLSIFGPGTPLTPPPTLSVSSPVSGDTVPNATPVIATAAAQRGVEHLDLYLNGYKWLTVKGAAFGPDGQPETTYALPLPAGVPDGVIDIVVKAYDDIEAETVAPAITVTKGAPCTSADTCLAGQKCEAGKCFWEPAAGQLGDACTYPQFCVSGNCLDLEGDRYCTQACVVGVTDSCPTGFECAGESGQSGLCVFTQSTEGGCCATGDDGKTSALLSMIVLGIVLRRRRR